MIVKQISFYDNMIGFVDSKKERIWYILSPIKQFRLFQMSLFKKLSALNMFYIIWLCRYSTGQGLKFSD